jgi:FSR family fosmidomycin resistance protein-like MFS transporter
MSQVLGEGVSRLRIGAAVLGRIADITSIFFVYRVCAWLSAIGLLTGLLPNLDRQRS